MERQNLTNQSYVLVLALKSSAHLLDTNDLKQKKHHLFLTEPCILSQSSVRYQKKNFVIPVKKVWSDEHQGTDDYWGLRPELLSSFKFFVSTSTQFDPFNLFFAK
jgi:hypothetical protein